MRGKMLEGKRIARRSPGGQAMLLDQIFTPFLAESPLSVMARATVEHALAAAALDQLFQQHAQTQYTRDLLFSSVVDLMSLVVTNVQRSVSAAYQARLVNVSVSLTSVYNKLQGIEDHVSAELVRHTATPSKVACLSSFAPA